MTDDAVRWWKPEILDRERWGELVEPALTRLLRARDRDRLPHALMLVGPAGLGRELAAVEAAVLLTCDSDRALWVDDACAKRVRDGVHPDVTAVFPIGKKRIIKIEQIREIVGSASGRPYEGERRVWIFNGVEAGHLGAAAANAFLKTLEEPPAHAVFVLLAANPTAVLPTIRSRCQQIALPGTVAVARRLADDILLPELAESVVGGEQTGITMDLVRSALESARDGETRHLIRLPYALPPEVPAFESVAAVALQMASEVADDSIGEELARLAAEMLTLDRRARALNLNRQGQMVSCLLRWFREL